MSSVKYYLLPAACDLPTTTLTGSPTYIIKPEIAAIKKPPTEAQK
ncbi:MAG: hypothetical protein O4751_03295 [Trichodesmium sp. St2_bin6]|nr:hypothetical protein [Trichodesmium sp. St2_bin6]